MQIKKKTLKRVDIYSAVADLFIQSPFLTDVSRTFSFCQNVADKAKTSAGPSKASAGRQASTPRKRLRLSASDREKLLDWDAAEESANGLVSSRKERMVLLEKSKLTQDGAPLFISVFLPSVVSLAGPKTAAEIRTVNSALCWPAFFPVLWCLIRSTQRPKQISPRQTLARKGKLVRAKARPHGPQPSSS